MYVYMVYVCEHMCGCVSKPKAGVRGAFFYCWSTLFTEAGSLDCT